MNHSQLSTSSLLIIGDLMLDKYLWGKVERISPEAPVPIVNIMYETVTLGGAGNVAHNLSSLGASSKILALVGQDNTALTLKEHLNHNSVNYYLIEGNNPSICKTRVLGGQQQMLRLDYEKVEKLSDSDADLVLEEVAKDIDKYQVVIISDYGKGFITPNLMKGVLKHCNDFDKKLIIDPKGSDWGKYAGAYIITPNLKELGDVLNRKIDNTDEVVIEAAKEVIAKYDFEYILVTRSEKGMTLVNHKEIFHVDTVAQEVFDVSGAGDTVVAVLGLGISSGYSMQEAVRLANFAAGVVVGKVGTSTVSLSELELFFNK